MTTIITRAEAKAAGLNKYFTGKACPKGHVDERNVSSRACVACIRVSSSTPEERERKRQDYAPLVSTPEGRQRHNDSGRACLARTKSTPEGLAKLAEQRRLIDARYKETHPGKRREINANNYAKNAAKRRAYTRQYYAENCPSISARKKGRWIEATGPAVQKIAAMCNRVETEQQGPELAMWISVQADFNEHYRAAARRSRVVDELLSQHEDHVIGLYLEVTAKPSTPTNTTQINQGN